MYQAKSGVKNFPFTWGGGSLNKNFFSPFWTCMRQIWCQKFFPLLGGGSLDKIFFFPSLNMYQAKSGVKNFPFTRGEGGPSTKYFFPQSEHVSSQIWCQKFFPLLGGGVPRQKFFSPVWHVSSQIWCQKFFPLLGEVPRQKIFFPSLNMYQAKTGVKKFTLYWDRGPPQKIWDLGPPHPWLDRVLPLPGPGPGTPPVEVWTDTQSENITSRHPSDAGGKYCPQLRQLLGKPALVLQNLYDFEQ